MTTPWVLVLLHYIVNILFDIFWWASERVSLIFDDAQNEDSSIGGNSIVSWTHHVLLDIAVWLLMNNRWLIVFLLKETSLHGIYNIFGVLVALE